MAKQKKNPTPSGALILHRFLLRQFDVLKFEKLAEDLKDSRLEGMDENKVAKISPAQLLPKGKACLEQRLNILRKEMDLKRL